MSSFMFVHGIVKVFPLGRRIFFQVTSGIIILKFFLCIWHGSFFSLYFIHPVFVVSFLFGHSVFMFKPFNIFFPTCADEH